MVLDSWREIVQTLVDQEMFSVLQIGNLSEKDLKLRWNNQHVKDPGIEQDIVVEVQSLLVLCSSGVRGFKSLQEKSVLHLRGLRRVTGW